MITYDPLPDIRVENEAKILRNAGYRVSIVTHKGDAPGFDKVYRVPRSKLIAYYFPMQTIAYWFAIRRIVKVEKPDLIYVHNALFPVALLLFRLFQKPIITDLHEFNSVNRLSRDSTVRRVQGALFRIDEIIHTTYSDGYVLVSPFVPSHYVFPICKETPHTYLENYATREQAELLSTPLSADEPRILPPKTDPSIVRIGYVGGVARISGRDFRELKSLVHEFEGKIEFHVVGASQASQDKNFYYHAKVSQQDAFQVLRELDVLIMNPLTRYPHPVSPNKFYQYAATGKPLIVDEHPSIVAYKDRLSLIFMDYDDPSDVRATFQKIVDQLDELQEQAKKNSKYVLEHLTWEAQAEKLVSFVEKIARSNSH